MNNNTNLNANNLFLIIIEAKQWTSDLTQYLISTHVNKASIPSGDLFTVHKVGYSRRLEVK